MRLLDCPLALLDDAPRNANRMPDERFRRLVESIRKIGFVQHVLVREKEGARYEIVDGHHRRRAMAEIGETSIPSVVLENGDDPALVSLAMNRLRGETDLAVAGQMLSDLLDLGVPAEDLALADFSPSEIQDLVDALENVDPSLDDAGNTEIPEEVGSPVLKPFLLELTFRTKDDLAEAKKALRKAAGKGVDLSDGLLRLVRAD